MVHFQLRFPSYVSIRSFGIHGFDYLQAENGQLLLMHVVYKFLKIRPKKDKNVGVSNIFFENATPANDDGYLKCV